ncbi:MAG: UDP-3-O-(3-hydroxymyristoyl)glucosamine N-acyltransferase [Holosporaceae bacterium]
MLDKRFFSFKGPLPLKELVGLGDLKYLRGDINQLIEDVAPIEQAAAGHISFVHNPAYTHYLASTKASAVVVTPDDAEQVNAQTAVLVSNSPLKVFALILRAFYQDLKPKAQVHRAACVAEDAHIGKNCTIGPGVVISEGATLGNNCIVEAGTFIGPNVSIGKNAHIGAHVSIVHALIGHHVTIKPGARLGQSGFGFFMSKDTKERIAQPQLGRVLVGDYVEIGANTTIDRGSLKDTVIASYVRIDNLVQIAHNVQIGEGSVIVAQAGIAGSATLEKGVVVAGQAGISGHLKVGAFARIAGQSGVTRSLEPGAEAIGSPAIPRRLWHKQNLALARLMKENKKPVVKEVK